MDMMTFLNDTSAKINEHEKNAKNYLTEGNNEAYLKEIHQKATILANLPAEIKKCDKGAMTSEISKSIEESMNAFAASAKTALELNSSWFMAQLLYNEDYKEGDSNNFELFVQKIKKEISA